MPESDFVFEKDNRIHVGSPVENTFVFDRDELVSDGEVSNFAFIRDRGFGAADLDLRITMTITEGGSGSVTFDDFTRPTYASGGIGWATGAGTGWDESEDDEVVYFDYMTYEDEDGNTIVVDDFERGNLDPYELTALFTDPADVWEVVDDGPTYFGNYSLKAWEHNSGITSQDGLDNYPSVGEPIYWRVYFPSSVTTATSWGGEIYFGVKDEDNLYRARIRGDDEELQITKYIDNDPELDAFSDCTINIDEWVTVRVGWEEI